MRENALGDRQADCRCNVALGVVEKVHWLKSVYGFAGVFRLAINLDDCNSLLAAERRKRVWITNRIPRRRPCCKVLFVRVNDWFVGVKGD